MSVEIEARVRRANLVSQDPHLDRLYGDELSHRLLRDVYSKKEGRMSEMTDRPEQGTVQDAPVDEKAFRPTRSTKTRSPAFVPAILTAVIAVGVIVALVARQPASVADTPIEVAEAFMAALNEHDAAAVKALLANEDAVTGEGVDGEEVVVTIEQQLEQEEILGWTYHVEECVESSILAEEGRSSVACTYAFSNDITIASGIAPYGGSRYDLVIADGLIHAAVNNENDGGFHSEALTLFFDWMQQNHPGEVDDMYYEYVDEENLGKWERFVPEFVAAMEEAG
jgi:hypothetical protein